MLEEKRPIHASQPIQASEYLGEIIKIGGRGHLVKILLLLALYRVVLKGKKCYRAS